MVYQPHQLTVIWMRKRMRHLDLRRLNWLLPSGRNNFSAAGNPTAVAAYSAFFLPPVLELTDAACLLLSPLPASCISMFPCTRFPHCRLSLRSFPLSPSTPYTVVDCLPGGPVLFFPHPQWTCPDKVWLPQGQCILLMNHVQCASILALLVLLCLDRPSCCGCSARFSLPPYPIVLRVNSLNIKLDIITSRMF